MQETDPEQVVGVGLVRARRAPRMLVESAVHYAPSGKAGAGTSESGHSDEQIVALADSERALSDVPSTHP
jgi:hypothetical protein